MVREAADSDGMAAKQLASGQTRRKNARARGQALRAAGTRASAGLAGEAAAAVERALDAGQRVGIDELAASLYTSRSRLCAVFKAETGESLGNYMRRRRMERAQDLLADSSLSIAQIATGCSATVWRGRHR